MSKDQLSAEKADECQYDQVSYLDVAIGLVSPSAG
jgi:hypothetical protein